MVSSGDSVECNARDRIVYLPLTACYILPSTDFLPQEIFVTFHFQSVNNDFVSLILFTDEYPL